jgi:uridine kinase
MELLIGSIGQQVLSVVPIVGMAGLGKTTIAKKIYQLAREKKLFDVTLWVCVSNDFSKGRILGEMLQNFDETTSRLSNLNAIMENLKKKLEKKTLLSPYLSGCVTGAMYNCKQYSEDISSTNTRA